MTERRRPEAPLPERRETVIPAPSRQNWRDAMEAVAEEDGYLEPVGPRHWAFFAETGGDLLVCFEEAAPIRARSSNMPAAWSLAKSRGWSLLCLISEGQTFWRANEVWGYFDRLVDDGFLEDFDRVLFYGAGAAGYAAASYVVAAPGARALLLSPLATLDPRIAGFDRRYLKARGLDFTSRYGYAPQMSAGAGHVWTLHDPHCPEDAAHAALFRNPWVTQIRSPWLGARIEPILARSGVLPALMDRAMAGTLTVAEATRLWREKRRNKAYLARLSEALDAKAHPELAKRLDRAILTLNAARARARG